MRLLILAATLSVFLLGCAAPPSPPEPQLVEFSLGQTRRVMQGRATVWFAQPDDEWREDLNAIAPVVRVEVTCRRERHGLVVFKDKPSDPACGIRLQLLRLEEPNTEVYPPRKFRAYLRVTPEPEPGSPKE